MIICKPMAGALGAEIEGIDLTQSLSVADYQQIRRMLVEHEVIFFRNQNITPAQQKSLASSFGPLQSHPAYENVEGIYGAGACKVAEDKGFSFNFWTDHDAAHAASDVIASIVSDAVANLITEPPQEITGQCDIWRNYVDFPVGKL